MRTLAAVLIFVASVPLAGGELNPAQEAEFWKGAGLDASVVRQVINNKNCAESEFHFHACRRALIDGAHFVGLEKDAKFRVLQGLKYQRGFDFASKVDAILLKKTDFPAEMVAGKTINGYMRWLDPYARLVPAKLVDFLLNGENKVYYSLGLETLETAAGLIVFHVYPSSSASSAGLKIHDRIVSVNGVTARDEFEAHALGQSLMEKNGTKFKLEIESGGKRSEVELQVSPLEYKEATSQLFVIGNRNIGYYGLRTFAQDSCLDLQRQIETWTAKVKLNGLILDLRHNIGGLTDEGKCVAQLFAGDKLIMEREHLPLEFPDLFKIEKNQAMDTGDIREWRRTFNDLPVVVLINERSASASELVAGSLQDYKRAWIVGERSYGKGTTQLIHRLENFPDLRVYKTVSRYLRPNKTSPQNVGVTPNFEVAFRAGAGAKERRFVREENLRRGMRLETAPLWVETRPAEKLKIDKCISQNKPVAGSDHQLETAFHVLACVPLIHNSCNNGKACN